ncbi:MAG: DUF488 family protein [Acidobacteria bacterium]|nr:DUF488 family protein [Acidobacteriota bacterium]
MFPLTTKRVYDPPSPEDGARILVMRFWPRRVVRSAADCWFPELGTSPPLIQQWKQGGMRRTEFRRAYLRELQDPAARQAITKIRKLLETKPATLMCSCPDEARCHRTILREVILQPIPERKIAVSRKGTPPKAK